VKTNSELTNTSSIQERIFTIRRMQVMLDRDLAEIYNVPTKRLNEQVKRNSKRFPESFRFQLTDIEKNELVANCDRFKKLKHSSINPYAFTEQGVAMLSAVLHSDIAIKISVKIMQAFAQMRNFILKNADIFKRIETIEKRQIIHQNEIDQRFEQIFKALEDKSIKPKQGIFFDGQIFDAYTFVSDLIRSAKHSILLIDNYIDDTVLTHFAKRKKKTTAIIYTKKISKQLKLDLKKYNEQYPQIEIKEFAQAHDRFLIIDNKEVYHFGASLKDLGKKWCAFSKMDLASVKILDKLKEND